MVNTSADDVDTMVDDQPIIVPDQGQVIHEHTPRAKPLASAPWPQSPEPHPRAQTLETNPPNGLQHLRLVRAQNPQLVVQTLREADAARNTADEDVNQHLVTVSLMSLSLMSYPLMFLSPMSYMLRRTRMA
jgi:hypothetical protein